MIEELITSGRNLPDIDPRLQVWGWEIPFYLYIGGLVAGILFFSALFTLRNREKDYPTAVKWLPMAAPVLLVLGLGALFLDLSHKLYFWQLYTHLRWESPMSWGAWTLLAITPLSILWAFSWLQDIFLTWQWPYQWLNIFFQWIRKNRNSLAWALIILALILGMYTGILLSAFNARPFWNSAILGPLFLTSGLSTGVAATLLFSRSHKERKLFASIDLILIGIEIFLIIHLFMGFLAGTRVHILAARLFLGGPYTAVFWVFIMGFGLIIPGILEILELRHKPIPGYIPAFLVLLGGYLLRVIIVDAGQASRWLY
ncbi:MAG: polysulfide reductase NrfD [FCB group bacterium]|nr:polysulfide reductase NrfD [FCB group bacterium]